MKVEERIRMMIGNLVVESQALAARVEELENEVKDLKEKLGTDAETK